MATILVVDDDPGVRDLVVRSVERLGYDSRAAGTGSEALVAVRNGGVDLVIADVYMPDMDGIEFLQRLTQEPMQPKVIVISGGGYEGRESVLERAAHLGAALTLQKPFSPQQLVDAIRQALNDGKKEAGKKKKK